MRIFLISLGIALVLCLPYIAVYYGVEFFFSGFFMVPVMAVHFVAIMAHEGGHTVARLLFGYPAIPGFDFELSLGVTRYAERSMALLCLFLAAMAGGVFFLKQKRLYRQARVLAGIAVVHGVVSFLPLHEVLILYMGHGAAVAIALFCVHAAVRLPERFHAGWRVALMSGALYVMLKNAMMCVEMMSLKPAPGFGIINGGKDIADFTGISVITGLGLPAVAALFLAFVIASLAVAAVVFSRGKYVNKDPSSETG